MYYIQTILLVIILLYQFVIKSIENAFFNFVSKVQLGGIKPINEVIFIRRNKMTVKLGHLMMFCLDHSLRCNFISVFINYS